jgi:heterodisulfide reductase subunit A-like polyferredoxin
MHGEKLLAFKYMNAHYVHIVKFSLERARDQRMLKKPTKKKVLDILHAAMCVRKEREALCRQTSSEGGFQARSLNFKNLHFKSL